MIKSTYKDYVQVFLPTKDKDDKQLCKEDIALWKKHMRKIFRKYMKGYHVSPYYRIEGDFLSSSGKWISEPNYIIKTFGPRKSCRELIKEIGRASCRERV